MVMEKALNGSNEIHVIVTKIAHFLEEVKATPEQARLVSELLDLKSSVESILY